MLGEGRFGMFQVQSLRLFACIESCSFVKFRICFRVFRVTTELMIRIFYQPSQLFGRLFPKLVMLEFQTSCWKVLQLFRKTRKEIQLPKHPNNGSLLLFRSYNYQLHWLGKRQYNWFLGFRFLRFSGLKFQTIFYNLPYNCFLPIPNHWCLEEFHYFQTTKQGQDSFWLFWLVA